jgi:hypothetical protein
MSHTTKIKSVPIRDIAALRSAVKDLQKQGISCELVQDAKPRMYYQDQLQRHLKRGSENCDYVLKLNNARYDVGFIKEDDGTYTPVFDDWQKSVAGQIGNPVPGAHEHWSGTRNDTEQTLHSIGKLLQGYTTHAMTNVATASGMMVEGTTIDKDGNIHLTLGNL